MSGGDRADFSHLPDVVWVRVMTYLQLQDRARVAGTCRALNSVFNHPSLWHTVSIQVNTDVHIWCLVLYFLARAALSLQTGLCESRCGLVGHPSSPPLSLADAASTMMSALVLFESTSLLYSQVLGDLNSYTSSNVILPEKYVKMIRRFGRYFQDLSLIFLG